MALVLPVKLLVTDSVSIVSMLQHVYYGLDEFGKSCHDRLVIHYFRGWLARGAHLRPRIDTLIQNAVLFGIVITHSLQLATNPGFDPEAGPEPVRQRLSAISAAPSGYGVVPDWMNPTEDGAPGTILLPSSHPRSPYTEE